MGSLILINNQQVYDPKDIISFEIFMDVWVVNVLFTCKKHDFDIHKIAKFAQY